MFTANSKPKQRKQINLVQGSPGQSGFKKGYMSFVEDSRMPVDALADLTNVTLDQDNLPRPRPSLVLFGEQELGPIIGAGTFIKIVAGVPEKWDISMQNISGVGKIHVRKDGEIWVVSGGTNSYSATAITNFCQSGNRVYASNGVNEMSYLDLDTGNINVYTALSTPSTPTATAIGALAGAGHTYRYRVSASNNVGETAASVADTEAVIALRDFWAPATQYVTVTWSAVPNAVSYNIYVGTVAGDEQYLASVAATSLTYKDDGGAGASGPSNALVVASPDDSTAGPKITYMYNKDGQLLGVGDVDNPDRLWYDGGSAATGDFSAFNGGGWVAINAGGDTVPVAVRAFRTGKGDPAITVLSKGVGGIGKMHHVVFTTTVFDNTVIAVPNISEVNGQGGTVSARAVVEANNSIWYPTGQDFKSTGSAENVQNILSTNSVSSDILPDVQRLNLSVMDEACGIFFENKIYWALPVGASSNNQIWVKDLSRGGIWIMPWTISAKFMWLSEDNTTGKVSLCVYDGTNVLEFSRSSLTSDNGTAFNTRVAHEGLVWSDDGMAMGAIREQRFKLLRPTGTINITTQGLDEDGAVNTLATEVFTQTSSLTGWAQFNFSDGEWPSAYSNDVGAVDFVSKQVKVVTLEIDETLNQLGWEITTSNKDCDYSLSSVLTTGVIVPNSYFGD